MGVRAQVRPRKKGCVSNVLSGLLQIGGAVFSGQCYGMYLLLGALAVGPLDAALRGRARPDCCGCYKVGLRWAESVNFGLSEATFSDALGNAHYEFLETRLHSSTWTLWAFVTKTAGGIICVKGLSPTGV